MTDLRSRGMRSCSRAERDPAIPRERRQRGGTRAPGSCRGRWGRVMGTCPRCSTRTRVRGEARDARSARGQRRRRSMGPSRPFAAMRCTIASAMATCASTRARRRMTSPSGSNASPELAIGTRVTGSPRALETATAGTAARTAARQPACACSTRPARCLCQHAGTSPWGSSASTSISTADTTICPLSIRASENDVQSSLPSAK